MKQLTLIESNSAQDEVATHSQAMSWNYDMSRAKSVSDFEEKYIEAMENPDAAGAAAVDYLMYSGYVTLGYFWARMAVLARQKIEQADGDVSFYEAKLMTARFYFDRILPRTRAHKKSMLTGPENLMSMPEAMFDF